MAGVLGDVVVLDLSWGVAGPMAAMLLADQGAQVTKIEPPGGDPWRSLSGSRVWNRNKRSAVLDLHDPEQRETLLALAERADVLLESFSPGTTERLGIDFDVLMQRNPRLIYCSITGYGRDTADAHRPAYDALVAARTGMQWEQRGWVGGTVLRMSGRPPEYPDLQPPEGCWEGVDREGPYCNASSFPSLAACFLATAGITAALHARETTGRGQRVETSLRQGVLAATMGGWQRAEHPDVPLYNTWVLDPRSTKGLFRCADGRWVYHWVPNPAFVLGTSEGDELRVTAETQAPRDDPTRILPTPEELVVLHYYYPLLAAAFAKFPASEWLAAAEQVGVAMQPVRSPEEALQDPAFLADGCVAVVEDPDVGPIRQVGRTLRLSAAAGPDPGPAPRVGADTEAAVADAARPVSPPRTPAAPHPLASALDGIRVLDLGLAVAGPFGTQVLSDLGADVIKVNTPYDGFWHTNHIAMACNRGKRSVAINLKDERGMRTLRRLVEGADVVHHNMRDAAAQRLGIDHESLRAIKPDLVYCHTRGFERGARDGLPGNDQTAAALAGVTWEDGGCDDGGRPLWSVTSLGDLGNGFLSAIGVLQALYHRDRTGEGCLVDTSIVYACLLNTSYVWTAESGATPPRPHLDGAALGMSARYGLYETADGWLCLAAVTEDQWRRCRDVLGLTDGPADDRDSRSLLETAFADAVCRGVVRRPRPCRRPVRGLVRHGGTRRVRRPRADRARLGHPVRAGHRRPARPSRTPARPVGHADPRRRSTARRGRLVARRAARGRHR